MKNLKYKVTNIDYDIDDKNVDDLPKTLIIEVPDTFANDEEIIEYISGKISDITGFTHNGFSTTPKLFI